MMRNEFEAYCHEGAHPSIVVNNSAQLTISQFREVLIRIRDYIANGGAKNAVDSDEIGNKYTHCDWGACSNNPEFFPDPHLHKWPQDFVDHNRVAPLMRPDLYDCPMRKEPVGNGRGCFWSCRIFQSKRTKQPTRNEALKLYDISISHLAGVDEPAERLITDEREEEK